MTDVQILPVDREDDASRRLLPLKAAIYARYSSIGNSPYSAEEQISRIKFRLSTGAIRSKLHPNAPLELDEKWVVKDEARTGRVTRDGYELIKSGIRSKAFDVLLADDISRLSRDMGGTIDLWEELDFHGVEGISVSDSISTADQNSRDLFIFKGYANEHQSKATSKNTIRGLELRVLKGFSTGHIPYGYVSAPTKTTLIKGIERPSHFQIAINEAQAQTIRKIWELFADGNGCRTIAKVLNSENNLSPKGGLWTEKTVWNITGQKKYTGIWEYRKTKVIRNPITDKLVQKARPKSEWLVSRREDLRIIPKELEDRVAKRRAQLEGRTKTAFRGAGPTPKHLFVGNLKCAKCGGNFISVSGGKHYLGCVRAHRQNSGSCDNRRVVKQAWLESTLLSIVRGYLDNQQTYAAIAARYNEKMAAQQGDLPKRLSQIESTIAECTKAIKNYDSFIRAGNWSDVIAKNLALAEQKLKSTRAEQEYLKSQMENRVYITPQAIRERMASLEDILHENIVVANQHLSRLFPEKITLTPLGTGRKDGYKANGVINLYSLLKFNNHVNGGLTVHYVAKNLQPFEVRIEKPR
jgi:DNA invertase Pin-like site-specific DNA recombinase